MHLFVCLIALSSIGSSHLRRAVSITAWVSLDSGLLISVDCRDAGISFGPFGLGPILPASDVAAFLSLHSLFFRSTRTAQTPCLLGCSPYKLPTRPLLARATLAEQLVTTGCSPRFSGEMVLSTSSAIVPMSLASRGAHFFTHFFCMMSKAGAHFRLAE